MLNNPESKIEWILLTKVAAIIGCTPNALHEYRKKGHIKKHFHWVKKQGRIYIHAERYNQWLGDSAE